MKKMSIKEYADFVGVCVPAIMYRIKNGKFLPGVKKYYPVMNGAKSKYVFEVNKNITSKEAKEYFQTKSI